MASTLLSVRPAHTHDAEGLAALARRVFAATYGSAMPPAALATYLREALTPHIFRTYIANNDLLVAHEGERLAGYARLVRGEPPACVPDRNATELAQLYIDQEFHGQGFGACLMEAAIARVPGALWLCAWRQNVRALRFYARYGFVEVGSIVVVAQEIAFDDVVLVRAANKPRELS